MKEKRTKKELLAVCLLVLALVLITVGTTFAFFQYSRQGEKENKIETGTLTFIYDETRSKDGGVSIENAFPMSDEDGKVLDQANKDVFDFDVRATTKGAAINYEIYVTKENTSTLPEQVVKTYLRVVKDGAESDPETKGLPTKTNLNLYSELYDSKVPSLLKDTSISKAKTLYREEIPDGQSNYEKTFRYRMWIDEKANQVVNGSWIYNDMTFSVKVNVYAQNGAIDDPTAPSTNPYQEPQDKSGANVPALVEGLIPVVYDGAQQRWVKAGYAGWYDYDKQEWANAVTVTATHRDTYQEAEPGIEIPMEDINTMWVWIPRYEYYIPDGTSGNKETCIYNNTEYDCYLNPGEIRINFINGISNTASTDDYIVHPAFTFGDDKLTGLWFAKFEPSNEEKKFTISAGSNSSDLTPIIKPNTTSWRYVRVVNAFYASRKMQTEKYEVYGFKANDGSIDTHMSKSSEWASVAYLSQSKYGKYGNDGEEVYINNCSNFTTGISGATESETSNQICSYTYETTEGQKASTTGNITGVYDMSGGANEYVMGALEEGETKKLNPSASGFIDDEISENKIPESKYYDLYTSTNPDSIDGNLSATACNKGVCYGHALSETTGWYSDFQTFLSAKESWFNRGGRHDSEKFRGIFSIDGDDGNAYPGDSFRLVLAFIGQ